MFCSQSIGEGVEGVLSKSKSVSLNPKTVSFPYIIKLKYKNDRTKWVQN